VSNDDDNSIGTRGEDDEDTDDDADIERVSNDDNNSIGTRSEDDEDADNEDAWFGRFNRSGEPDEQMFAGSDEDSE
jgi:hypothetical protein